MIRLTLHGSVFIWVRPDAVQFVRGWKDGAEVGFATAAFNVNERPEAIVEMIRTSEPKATAP